MSDKMFVKISMLGFHKTVVVWNLVGQTLANLQNMSTGSDNQEKGD